MLNVSVCSVCFVKLAQRNTSFIPGQFINGFDVRVYPLKGEGSVD